MTAMYTLLCQVVRVILLWVNNHFRDFEMLPDMADILDKFSSLLEKNVRMRQIWHIQHLSGIFSFTSLTTVVLGI